MRPICLNDLIQMFDFTHDLYVNPRRGLTPKALANVSPGLERSDNPGLPNQIRNDPEGVCSASNPFRFGFLFFLFTQGCRCAPTLG